MGMPTLPQPPSDHTRDLLKFLQDERESIQKHFMWYVALLSAAVILVAGLAAFLGFRSLDDYKEQLKRQAKEETEKAVIGTQQQVKKELDDQFATPQLQKMIHEAAEKSVRTATKDEIDKQMNAVRRQVTAEVSQQSAEVRSVIASTNPILIDLNEGRKRLAGLGDLYNCWIGYDKNNMQASYLASDIQQILTPVNPKNSCNTGGNEYSTLGIPEGVAIQYDDAPNSTVAHDAANALYNFLHEKNVNCRIERWTNKSNVSQLQITIGNHLVVPKP